MITTIKAFIIKFGNSITLLINWNLKSVWDKNNNWQDLGLKMLLKNVK